MRDRLFVAARTLVPLFALLLAAAPAVAKEVEQPGAVVAPPPIQPGRAGLLPFTDLEWQDFNREHGPLLYRTRALGKRVGGLAQNLGKRKNKKDKESQRLKSDIKRLRVQIAALHARMTDELVASGVDPMLIPYMNKTTSGPRMAERYAYGLVLLLPDLSPTQRALYERLTAQMEGAAHAIAAQKERTTLGLKQAQLPKDQLRAISGTFDRQLRVIDQRYWQLTDFTLTREQRAQMWRWLPRGMKRKSQAVEHLYALPGITASQGTRLKALLTEVEHESSPDSAAVKRINTSLRKKDVDRAALTKERGEAYKRLGELRRYSASVTRKILTDEQWLAYEAIPPRVSTGDRRRNFKQLVKGWKPTSGQQMKMNKLLAELRKEQRTSRRRTNELRRKGGDYGPDSPQMAGMQMEMQGVQADVLRSQRAFNGKLFMEVMTPEEVTRWLMGHYGYKK